MTLNDALAIWMTYPGLGPNAEVNAIRNEAWKLIQMAGERAMREQVDVMQNEVPLKCS